MIYEVSQKKGESLRIGLREIGEGQYEIQMEGRTIHVDAVRPGPNIYSLIEDGKQFEVMVDEQGAHEFDVMVSGRLFHLESLDERTKLLSGSAAHVASGPQTIAAEMAGKVVKIQLEPGAQVSEGEGVVVVEAMKMENEIASPIDGVLVSIDVSEGETVEAGATLFVVEPPAEDDADG